MSTGERELNEQFKLTGVLVCNAFLALIEAFTRFVGPPFLQFTVLIVQTTRRVKRVLQDGECRMSQ
jgi:hypothetical protein